ncbi:uncharacterized protein N0V96_005585 [Colletotrichum fioriniae]|uniref:uncharacterized protein n=1 Tax=Colletotrichum fioriniae TaxID=710243 RepID=UPI0032DBED55|nr:hypothetical protein N0V96_005585 [Colletotrichum fioriniae]
MLTVLEENGRTYHAMSSGSEQCLTSHLLNAVSLTDDIKKEYPFPNDIVEQERLDFQHLMWSVTLDDKLCLCPKGSQKAKRVLDAGTGTGIWAMDYADAHPEAKVIGVDLSNIQPKWGGRVTGRNMDAAPTYAALMRTAGFVDVEEHQFKWPVNAWPRDPHFKTLGAYTHCNLDHGLEGLTLGLATRNLGWSKEETLLFCATVRKSLRSHRVHAYVPL